MSEKICELPKEYKPSEQEKFVNEFQREYFRRKLVSWKENLLLNNNSVIKHLQEEGKTCADAIDRASTETDLTYELRTKERATKLVAKIDAALAKIKNGTYGYCEETGDPISLKRLEARPIATLSLAAQERHEKQERSQKDD
ncbi:MAG: RNA polymerase-binding protein DksA [Holosporaceae bacterium]|jgi:DnaK suppressor protein|nr:RNA polymerase-binding protein DksA [Holosporaceae bacterium]